MITQTDASTPSIPSTSPLSTVLQSSASRNKPVLGDKTVIGFSVGIGLSVLILVSGIAAFIRKKRSQIHDTQQHHPEVVSSPLSSPTGLVEKYGCDRMDIWAAPTISEMEGRMKSYELQSDIRHEMQRADYDMLGGRGHQLQGPEAGGQK
ncbi:hypothetical protein PtrSN002B_006619 [Pyrenophora tritici-repentis]|uniref:Uncharacterized protein n=2 Tax=Pyrenophora tritici-repentis TaxID=45151 RepID=A0A2W1DPX2_9PLEO|nr:uncharacterized protein PTRG_04947 [Pyrenophora tritici-repentis Pt-1C-BFP]KAA8611925.1 hypothetical protein PtrV1_13801 [Pyrenophora tritici-repentis]EDU47854.1 hypothetical protein PTRG_04947 [Pyrenophora tritici-repentis Pt-1C-BFP]KAF7447175.1 hypothetical protein A1F99_086220 [Pyrenophora tritici-repentis]KAG9382728.1 hypothetical protein A1F94_006649 [Pyrenophora tritici-repentis]KAI0570990.1 hypothetical protein Alg215_10700 [Pyrenophora tritici-repentis]